MTGKPVRVAAIQLDISGTIQAVQERALQQVRFAARHGAQFVCLPEHWIPKEPKGVEAVMVSLQALAKEESIFIISGGNFTGKDPTFVRSLLLGPNGEIGRQHKVHLFERERRLARPGEGYPVMDLGGIRVGIAICHDIVYPEVARILALKGAEVIFAPAMIGPSGIAPWELYIKARALENRIPIVSPNVYFPPRFKGGSLIVGLSPADKFTVIQAIVLARKSGAPGTIFADLDLDAMKAQRRKRLRERRVETYGELLMAG